MRNTPVILDFEDHYKGDGLQPFKVQFEYASGNPVELADSVVRMQLKNSLGQVAYDFSSEMEGDNKLTILEGGWLQFPRILSWQVPATKYNYDMQVTADDGNVRTYIKGTWRVNQDITI